MVLHLTCTACTIDSVCCKFPMSFSCIGYVHQCSVHVLAGCKSVFRQDNGQICSPAMLVNDDDVGLLMLLKLLALPMSAVPHDAVELLGDPI